MSINPDPRVAPCYGDKTILIKSDSEHDEIVPRQKELFTQLLCRKTEELNWSNPNSRQWRVLSDEENPARADLCFYLFYNFTDRVEGRNENEMKQLHQNAQNVISVDAKESKEKVSNDIRQYQMFLKGDIPAEGFICGYLPADSSPASYKLASALRDILDEETVKLVTHLERGTDSNQASAILKIAESQPVEEIKKLKQRQQELQLEKNELLTRLQSIEEEMSKNARNLSAINQK